MLSPILEIDFKHIDVALGMMYHGQELGLYKKMLRRFYENYLHFIEEWTTQLTEQHYDDSKRMLHTIKGLSGSIGAKDLQNGQM